MRRRFTGQLICLGNEVKRRTHCLFTRNRHVVCYQEVVAFLQLSGKLGSMNVLAIVTVQITQQKLLYKEIKKNMGK